MNLADGGATRNIAENNTLIGLGMGCNGRDASILLFNNTFDGGGTDGLVWLRCNDVTVTNNLISNADRASLFIMRHPDDVGGPYQNAWIERNTLQDCGQARDVLRTCFRFEDYDNSQVIALDIQGRGSNTWATYILRVTNTTMRDTVISAASEGFRVFSSSNLVFANTTFAAIDSLEYLFDASDGITIRNQDIDVYPVRVLSQTSPTTITWNWSDRSPSEQYTLRRTTGGTAEDFPFTTDPSGSGQTTVPNPTGVTYTYSLVPPVPSAVADLEAIAVGGDYVLLSWTAPAGADQYDLRYSTSGPINEANFQAATQVATSTPQAPGTVETLIVTGLIAETTYWLALRSGDAVPNWSPVSNVIQITTLDTVDPGTIVDLQVVNFGGDYAVLQWTAPGDDGNQGIATAYEVRHSAAGLLNDTNFDAGTLVPSPTPALAGSTENLNVTGLSPLTPYWFALRTADEVPNWSPVSNNAAILTLDTLPPAIVSDLQVTGSGHDYVTLQWTAPGDDGNQGTASTYDIRFSSSGPLNDTNFIAGTSVATSAPAQAGLVEALNVSGLSPQTQYWFALRSADEVPNWSPVSNNAVATTPDTVPPARVTDVHVSSVGGEFVVLQWTAPGDDGNQGIGASYEVRYSSSGPLNETTFGTGTSVSVPAPAPSGTTESLTVTGLSPETQYWFALRTADDVPNWSPVSNSPTATTHAIDDTPPTAGFVSPVEGAIVTGTVRVEVQASDDEGIREVAAFADGNLLGVLTVKPYVWDWSTASFEPGSHTLTAVASDTSGNLAFASVNVTLMALPGEELEGGPPWVLSINYVPLGPLISIVFSEEMNRWSVEEALNLYPSIFYQVTWSTSSAFTIVLEEPLNPAIRYLLLIDAFATDVEGESMERGFAFTFGSSEPAPAPLLRNPWVWAAGVLAVWWTVALVLYFRGHRNVLTLRDTLQRMTHAMRNFSLQGRDFGRQRR